MPSDLKLTPAPPKPPVDGARPFNIRAPWHRNSGDAAAHLSPAPEKPKATAAAVAFRKLRNRELHDRLTASIAKGFAVRGWAVPR